MKVGIINSHMYGRNAEPGEYVDWSAPDIYDEEEWWEILGMRIVDYAAISPHLIVFEVAPDTAGLTG